MSVCSHNYDRSVYCVDKSNCTNFASDNPDSLLQCINVVSELPYTNFNNIKNIQDAINTIRTKHSLTKYTWGEKAKVENNTTDVNNLIDGVNNLSQSNYIDYVTAVTKVSVGELVTEKKLQLIDHELYKLNTVCVNFNNVNTYSDRTNYSNYSDESDDNSDDSHSTCGSGYGICGSQKQVANNV